jgi:hypothetical protein
LHGESPVDASITVEVFSGAADRFGGKIVTMWRMALDWAWDAA